MACCLKKTSGDLAGGVFVWSTLLNLNALSVTQEWLLSKQKPGVVNTQWMHLLSSDLTLGSGTLLESRRSEAETKTGPVTMAAPCSVPHCGFCQCKWLLHSRQYSSYITYNNPNHNTKHSVGASCLAYSTYHYLSIVIQLYVYSQQLAKPMIFGYMLAWVTLSIFKKINQ